MISNVLIQGIFEAFPVSSNLHAIFFENTNLMESAVMHFGTAVAFSLFSYKSIFDFLKRPIKNLKKIYKIITLTLPTIATGFYLKDADINLNIGYENAIINILFASFLLLSNYFEEKNDLTNIEFYKIFSISFLLPLAFIPGASRFGTTFSLLRLLKLTKNEAFLITILTGSIVTSGASFIGILKHFELSLIQQSLFAGIITYFGLFLCKHILFKKPFFIFLYRIFISFYILINVL